MISQIEAEIYLRSIGFKKQDDNFFVKQINECRISIYLKETLFVRVSSLFGLSDAIKSLAVSNIDELKFIIENSFIISIADVNETPTRFGDVMLSSV